jgi:small subunit ribosomal protein S20
MANHASAKQRIRRNDRRSEINGARVGRIRSFVKKIETAISGGDKAAARDALKSAQPEMQRGVSAGVMHRNTVARRISRLNARIKAMP